MVDSLKQGGGDRWPSSRLAFPKTLLPRIFKEEQWDGTCCPPLATGNKGHSVMLPCCRH